jgi:hypothetical protein
MTASADLGLGFLPDGQPVGWRVLDADGNVVQAGPVSEALMTAEMAESLGITEGA